MRSVQAPAWLGSDEVDRMVKDAETNSESDKKKRAAIDTRNNVRAARPAAAHGTCLMLPLEPAVCRRTSTASCMLPAGGWRISLCEWHCRLCAACCWCFHAAPGATAGCNSPVPGVQADSMLYQTEKQLKEFGDKVPADVKSKIEAGLQTLRDAVSKDDTEAMLKGIDSLRQETMAMGQAMYSQV